MNAVHAVAALSALEAASDALLVAVAKLPDPDLDAVDAALNARETALRFFVRIDPAVCPPGTAERLARVLERDAVATRRLREELTLTADRLRDLARAHPAEATYDARGAIEGLAPR